MPATKSANRDVTINIRARTGQRDLIDRASARLGKSRSDFMLETACREAETVLLDQTLFSLDTPAWRKFMAMLDAPARPSKGLRDLMATKAPWER
jgi:uncharacterized protein (DUF1778 family)